MLFKLEYENKKIKIKDKDKKIKRVESNSIEFV